MAKAYILMSHYEGGGNIDWIRVFDSKEKMEAAKLGDADGDALSLTYDYSWWEREVE